MNLNRMKKIYSTMPDNIKDILNQMVDNQIEYEKSDETRLMKVEIEYYDE